MRVSRLAIAIGALFGVLVTLQPVFDTDLFWHLETGRRTIAGELPRVDLFSWTVRGMPVFTDQWLGDALLALGRALLDWRGVLLIRALAVTGLVTIVCDTALAARPRAPLVAMIAALPAIALSRFVWTDRPELFGLVCFAILVRLLRDGSDRGLLLSLPLLALWAQLHGSFALGFGLVLATCAARALTDTRERWRYVPIAAFAVLATLLTPSGLGIWTSAGGHFLSPPRYIREEGVPDPTSFPGVLFLVTLALVLATAALSRRVTLREAALLVPVAFVAMTAMRHTPFLAVAAAPFFAAHWPDPLAARRTDAATSRAPSRTIVLALAMLAIVLAVARTDDAVDETGYPRSALAAVPPGDGLLNQYEWGGWLMTAAPDRPVFIDGRLFPFVPEVLSDYRVIVNAEPGWELAATRRGVRTILVRAVEPIAVRAPERGWRVAYRDDLAVVLVR